MMDKFIYNETNGLWYELQGDYYLPCLKLPEEEWRISAYGDSGLSFLMFFIELVLFSSQYLIFQGRNAILCYDTIYSAGKEYLSLNTSKKAERTKEIIGACLDCFGEKGLMQLAKMKG